MLAIFHSHVFFLMDIHLELVLETSGDSPNLSKRDTHIFFKYGKGFFFWWRKPFLLFFWKTSFEVQLGDIFHIFFLRFGIDVSF